MPEERQRAEAGAKPDESRAGWRALIVGIDRFARVGGLQGAAQDAAQAEAFAREGLRIPPENITVLTNEAATREAVIAALRALGDAELTADDQVFVHISSHGTRMLDPLDQSPSGFIECLVVYDSGPGGAWHIPDLTMGALFDRVTRKTERLTVVIDTCHSGSATRSNVRLTNTDKRSPPADLDAHIRAEGSGVLDGTMRYVVLAACQDRELAFEHHERVGDQTIVSGLFSRFLYPALRAARSDTSYRMLMERVAVQVSGRQSQHPLCEGRADRAIFGGADVRVDRFLTVVGERIGSVAIDGGTLHGLRPGDRVAFYGPELRTLDQLKAGADDVPVEPLAIGTLTAVDSTRSSARIEPPPEGRPAPESLMFARVLREGPLTDGGTVRFEVEPGARPLGKPPHYIQWRLAEPGEVPDTVVKVGHTQIELLDAAGHQRVSPQPRSGEIWDSISIIARVDRLKRLRNPDRGSLLQDGFEIRVRRLVDDHDARKSPVIEPTRGRVVLPYDPGAPTTWYMTELINRTTRTARPHLLLLNADYSVVPLLSQASGARAVDDGRAVFVGHRDQSQRFAAFLPGDVPGDAWWVRADNTLLLLASRRPINVDLLRQGGIRSQPPQGRTPERDSLTNLLADCAAGRRMLRRRAPEDWGAQHFQITVLRRPAEVRPVGAGALPIGLGFDAAGIEGTLCAAEFDRMALFTPLDRPPLESLSVAGLEPVLSPARGSGTSPLVVRVVGKAAPGAKLTLKVPTEDQPLVPVAFDRAGHTVVGRPGGPGEAVFDLPTAFDRPFLLARPRSSS